MSKKGTVMKMSEEAIIFHCAPTLAGIKTANLFRASFSSAKEMRDEIRALNHKLVCKGVRVMPLLFRDNAALIYLYRPSLLRRDLTGKEAADILAEHGYFYATAPERCIAELVCKLNRSCEFPHEIGLFLGYPPEDVRGFIENKASSCKIVGYWKVYGDECKAKNLFAKYKKCTDAFLKRHAKGSTLEMLTVTVK